MELDTALRRRAQRERQARKEAESLLEEHSRQLHATNKQLAQLTVSLEEEIGKKTHELLNAQRVAGLGTLIWDIEAEVITWSDGVYFALGLEPEKDELSFEGYVAAIHEEERDEFVERVTTARATGFRIGDVYSAEHRIVRPDGEIRWMQLQGEISAGYSEFGLVMFGTVQDVTTQKVAEQELQKSTELVERRVRELERAQEELAKARDVAEDANRAKSRFLAMMSHEIRTPMNGVLGALTLLEDTGLADNQRELVSLAASSAETLQVILNDIIDLARLEKEGDSKREIVTFDLRELVHLASEFWRPLAESKGVALDDVIPSDVPQFVFGEPGRIRQVLNNLVSNAIKFTREGSIEVRLSLDRIEVPVTPNQVWVKLSVKDTGVGIAENEQDRLFEEFSQVGDARVGELGGSGLGLAICRALALRLGGSVGVVSAPGLGSEFWLRIPLEIAPRPQAPASDSSSLAELKNIRGESPRILLVEDIPANQIVASLIIKGFGCGVDLAATGLEAVNAVENHRYDLVLMDIAMPEMGGLEATRQIRNRTDEKANIPIIGVTAFAFSEDLKRFLQEGMDDVVNKPLQRNNLHEAMARALCKPERDRPLDHIRALALDVATLSALTDGFTPDQTVALLGKLILDLRSQGEAAVKATLDSDIHALQQHCHAIKGVAASFGCLAVSELAKEIEYLCESENTQAAFALVRSSLERLIDSSVLDLENHINAIAEDSEAAEF